MKRKCMGCGHKKMVHGFSPKIYRENTSMSDPFYVNRLYPLQDAVLKSIGPFETGFYLTDGTAYIGTIAFPPIL
jgi:hypothetical protein